MLDNETKRRIDTARNILVGKVPDPKSQVEQITIALIYKFMNDMDAVAEELADNESKIVKELNIVQGKPIDLGGYYKLNDKLAIKAMRPSATFNAAIKSFINV